MTPSALVLGDNLFHGNDLGSQLKNANSEPIGATIFAYPVTDPERYGVVEFDERGQAISIEEKPQHPKSRYAPTGLYFYDADVVEVAKTMQPSARDEWEITDVNRIYLEAGKLNVKVMGRGNVWLDTGTHDLLLEALQFIQTLEKRQGLKIACSEEIAWRAGWINNEQIQHLAEPLAKSGYGKYLIDVVNYEGKS